MYVYPRGTQLSHERDPFVRSMIQEDESLVWPLADAMNALKTYELGAEKQSYDFNREWEELDI